MKQLPPNHKAIGEVLLQLAYLFEDEYPKAALPCLRRSLEIAEQSAPKNIAEVCHCMGWSRKVSPAFEGARGVAGQLGVLRVEGRGEDARAVLTKDHGVAPAGETSGGTDVRESHLLHGF